MHISYRDSGVIGLFVFFGLARRPSRTALRIVSYPISSSAATSAILRPLPRWNWAFSKIGGVYFGINNFGQPVYLVLSKPFSLGLEIRKRRKKTLHGTGSVMAYLGLKQVES